MRIDKEYLRAVTQAKENLANLNERGADAVGENVLEFMESILTPDEIAESRLLVSIIGELIKARQEKKSTGPQMDTILKVLAPLGKTLAVVPLETGNR